MRCRVSSDVLDLCRGEVGTYYLGEAHKGRHWRLALARDGSQLEGLEELIGAFCLPPGGQADLGLEGRDEILCIHRQTRDTFRLFLKGQDVGSPSMPVQSLENFDSSAESSLRAGRLASFDRSQDQAADIVQMEHELAEVTQALDKGKQKAKTAEEELALLLRRAEHASQAVRMYSSSAEEGLKKLLLASEQLHVEEGDPRSAQMLKLRTDMREFTSRLQQSMQEISLLTNEVEDLSTTFGQPEVNSSEAQSKTDIK